MAENVKDWIRVAEKLGIAPWRLERMPAMLVDRYIAYFKAVDRG